MNAALIAQAKLILPGALLAIVAAAMTITDAYATAQVDEVVIRVAGTPCAAIARDRDTADAHAGVASRAALVAHHACIAPDKS